MNGSYLKEKDQTIGRFIVELQRGIELVERLGDDEFAQQRDGHSSIGAHIRHCLDFANALLNGLDERRIDYNQRERDPRVEMDRRYATEQMSFASRRLQMISSDVTLAVVMVRSEIDQDTWHVSSVSREIEFLHGHTIHHFALINLLIRETVSSTFGVAPSTLRFRASR